jgi:hypothetical protein
MIPRGAGEPLRLTQTENVHYKLDALVRCCWKNIASLVRRQDCLRGTQDCVRHATRAAAIGEFRCPVIKKPKLGGA